MDILYEDNHLIAVNKRSGEPIQGDISKDESLLERTKKYIKERDNKPGNVYLGLIHRLDRPVSGVVLFAKTSKCLSRMNAMLRANSSNPINENLQQGDLLPIRKTYWAIVEKRPEAARGTLCNYLRRNEKQNKTYISDEGQGKYAKLEYKTLAVGQHYSLLEIDLLTGRHHQIRCQLANIGCVVKGDLKYGAKRSNPDGSICLHARAISFEHPIRKDRITVVAPCPQGSLWQQLSLLIKDPSLTEFPPVRSNDC